MMSVAELREIAHRAGHYKTSYGPLPVVRLPQYTCDPLEGDFVISYLDLAEVFATLARLLEKQPEQA